MALLDSVGMFDLAAGLPEQVAAAATQGAELEHLPDHDAIEHVVVLGMGGSGISGDVLQAVAAPFMSVPVTVVRGYDAPHFVSESTLCFAVSYSGDTEETVEAAQSAAGAGARMVVLSTGGQLADLAAAWDAPHIRLPDIPMPRAGIGAVSIPPLLVLERVGLFPGAAQYVEEAVQQLRRRRDALVLEGSSAHRLAEQIGRTIPVAYGGDAIGEVAAYRFKCQVNENAKAPAFSGAVPEMCHNEICGWGQHGDVTRQVMTVVRFRHDFEHPQVARRFELTHDVLDEVVHGIVDVRAEGDGALAQLFDLVLQGDFVSLHLAAQAGVDPGPIPVLEDLKAALAR
ncbi:MAG TPA: bifunctional phosphoglucose/phosphomannose isomerase [Acidimicrobiales bacterium]|nr:bifunctional phosphoglucose/phosphomannose isomerase [Acidimicrobiales bacterium]